MNEYEQKVNEFLDKAIDAERAGDIAVANRNFRFAAFYEGKRLGVDAKEYANSVGNVIE